MALMPAVDGSRQLVWSKEKKGVIHGCTQGEMKNYFKLLTKESTSQTSPC